MVERSRSERAEILIVRQIDAVGESHYLHTFGNSCAAGHDGLFLIADGKPDLAIDAFAVPTKITVTNIFHRQKLKTPQERIILRHHMARPADVDLDQLVVWLKYLRLRHKDLTRVSCLSTAG